MSAATSRPTPTVYGDLRLTAVCRKDYVGDVSPMLPFDDDEHVVSQQSSVVSQQPTVASRSAGIDSRQSPAIEGQRPPDDDAQIASRIDDRRLATVD